MYSSNGGKVYVGCWRGLVAVFFNQNTPRSADIYRRQVLGQRDSHMPVLGMTPKENLQLGDRNQPEDIADVLGMTAFKGYVNTPIQTLDSISVQQLKWFLLLAEEAK